MRLLGPFSVTVAGEPVAPGAWRLAKAQHIVKLVALAPHHRMHRDELLDVLWRDLEPRSAANNLYQALWAARRAIASVGGDGRLWLRLEDEWVAFAPEGGAWVDVEVFEALSGSDDPEDLRTALSLYRGELLADDRYAEWLMPRRDALSRTRRDLVRRLATHSLDAGDLLEARRLLEHLLEDDPADENAHQALIRVHALSGDRAAAQHQYEALEAALHADLDVEPSPQSRRLLEEVRTGSLSPGESRAPPPVGSRAAPRKPPNNLPAVLSSFVGRERELSELAVAITRHRLVTLTGSGGCGKTRLATEVAGRSLLGFPEGVFLVELGPLTARSRVDLEITRTLGVRGTPQRSPVERLADRIGSGRWLLVLDNCEHLIDQAATVTEALLSACPRLVLVATSREPLRLPGELIRRVPSLRLPDLDDLPPPGAMIQCEAVRLLVDRVSAGDPDFELGESNAAAVAQICVRLDGMPLALELAAALIPTLAPIGVAAGLDDRFHLLTTGRRAGLTRHQTLEAAIAWGFDLLPEEQRHLLCRLATFRDSFDVAAAAAVGIAADTGPGAVAARLADLADRSMIVAEPAADQPRFRLLETIREYAVAQLRERGVLDEALDAHARWFAQHIRRSVGELSGPDHHRWLVRLDQSRTDLTAAMARLRVIDPAETVRLAAALWQYWLWFGYLDSGMHELETALSHENAPSEARSACWLGVFALHSRWRGVSNPTMQSYVDNAVAEARAAGSPAALSRALLFDGIRRMMIDLDPTASAGGPFDRAAEIAATAGLGGEQATALQARAVLEAHCSRFQVSWELLQRTLRLLCSLPRGADELLMLPVRPIATSRRLGVPWLIWEETLLPHLSTAGRSAETYVRMNLANLERVAGHTEAARRHYESALTSYQAERDETGQAIANARLGWLALAGGRLEEATSRMQKALQAYADGGEVRGHHMMRLGLSRVAIEQGTPDVARGLIGEVLLAAREQGDKPVVFGALDVRGTLDVAVGDVGTGIEALRESLGIVARMGHRLTAAVVNLDLADAHLRAGALVDAADSARAALTVFEVLGYEQSAARCRQILTEGELHALRPR